MEIRDTVIPGVLNQALRYQFGWSNHILDPLFCDGKRYECGYLFASWIRAEWHFPIIAYKYGITIVVYDSCTNVVAGDQRNHEKTKEPRFTRPTENYNNIPTNWFPHLP